MVRCAGIVGVCLLAAACSSEDTLGPFSSDGCSLFPDRSLISRTDWCSCCFEHDIAYWRGGTSAEREAADSDLRDCIAARTQNQSLADVMYEGVRFGGSPYFYNWYRWGYGWNYDRKYQALDVPEIEFADELLAAYRAGNPDAVCPVSSGRR